MLEVEVKSPLSSAAETEERILALGGSFKGEIAENDTYYNHPSRDFRETGEAFRVRESGKTSCITYKGPVLPGAAKSRYEAETGVSSSNILRDILEKLGFVEAGRVTKVRRQFALDGCHVTIDDVCGAGMYLEVEKTGGDKDALEKDVIACAGRLGAMQFEKRSYLALVLQKKAECSGKTAPDAL